MSMAGVSMAGSSGPALASTPALAGDRASEVSATTYPDDDDPLMVDGTPDARRPTPDD